MIPILYNDGPVWLVGIAWNAEILAAFLAWWMPVNLLSYLGFLSLFTYLDEGEWEKKVFSIQWILGMTLGFYPWVVGNLAYFSFVAFVYQPIKNRRALR